MPFHCSAFIISVEKSAVYCTGNPLKECVLGLYFEDILFAFGFQPHYFVTEL
jgi:hypothetical protein